MHAAPRLPSGLTCHEHMSLDWLVNGMARQAGRNRGAGTSVSLAGEADTSHATVSVVSDFFVFVFVSRDLRFGVNLFLMYAMRDRWRSKAPGRCGCAGS